MKLTAVALVPTTIVLVLISSNEIAQASAAQRDPVLDQEKAIAVKVEARSHIDRFDLQNTTPEIRIDAGRTLSFYDNGTGNVVHEEYWEKAPLPEQTTFNQWATYTGDESSGRQLFQDMFYRFFFVHELGHWMRISVAWWREHDQAYLAKLVNDFRKIQRKLPTPVPKGEDTRAFFTSEYDKLSEDPNAYGWFQLQMVISAYDKQPAMSFQQAIDKLPTENYDE